MVFLLVGCFKISFLIFLYSLSSYFFRQGSHFFSIIIIFFRKGRLSTNGAFITVAEAKMEYLVILTSHRFSLPRCDDHFLSPKFKNFIKVIRIL